MRANAAHLDAVQGVKPILDHVHLTVRDLGKAERFYDGLMPLLGYNLRLKERTVVPEHDDECIEYHHPNLPVGIVSPRRELADTNVNRRVPGAVHHLAFLVGTLDEVDRLFEAVSALPGVEVVGKPQFYRAYCPDYYAFLFKDPDGIKLEVVHFKKDLYFKEP